MIRKHAITSFLGLSLISLVACGSENSKSSAPAAEATTTPGLTLAVADESGKPLEGAMVSLVDKDELRLTTRFAQASGTVRFASVAPDENAVRVRLAGYTDQYIDLDKDMHDLKTVLKKATKNELLDSLPANVWAERIVLPDDRMNTEFRVQCMMCHQIGYPNSRIHVGREDWYGVYERMANKGTAATLTAKTRDAMADAMTAAFSVDGPLGMPRIPEAPKGEATNVEITEWRLDNPAASMHDVAVGPDGLIYGVDTIGSNIWRLDPATNEIEELTDLKPENRPEGTPLLLHTVIQAPDGKMWFTYAFGNLIARLDVKTDEMKVWEMDYKDGAYPHTMRFDADGQIWFTVSYTNQLGTIDPESDKIVLYDMPVRNAVQEVAARPENAMAAVTTKRDASNVVAPQDEIRTVPYGIAATPDGKIWFSQFNNRRIGSFDKKTETFHMVDTPFGGPRRFRSDSEGNLWIPDYAEGGLYKYEPAFDKFTRVELPTGRGDAVYALNVNPKDDTVWACGSNSDTMMHLMPKTGEVVTYTLPSHVTFCREINFAEDGSVWTSYSQYPSGSIEGGSSAFVRIKPLDQ